MKIGITGGIASGKSTICKYIESIGYPVFYSDDVAKQLVDTNKNLRTDLVEKFGSSVFKEDGTYNSSFMFDTIFKNEEELKKLNIIFSDYMTESWDVFYERHKEDHKLIFYETALIFEHNKEDYFDFIICAYCNFLPTVDRLFSGRGMSQENIKWVMKNQMPPEHKILMSDFYLDTTNNINYKLLDFIITLLNGKEKTPWSKNFYYWRNNFRKSYTSV